MPRPWSSVNNCTPILINQQIERTNYKNIYLSLTYSVTTERQIPACA